MKMKPLSVRSVELIRDSASSWISDYARIHAEDAGLLVLSSQLKRRPAFCSTSRPVCTLLGTSPMPPHHANGRKCRSAALRCKPFCFHHAKLHFRTSAKRRLKEFTGSDLHDLNALRRATAKALEALSSPMVDTRRAGLLLYGLHLAANLQKRASISLPQITMNPAWAFADGDGDDESGGECTAPDAGRDGDPRSADLSQMSSTRAAHLLSAPEFPPVSEVHDL